MPGLNDLNRLLPLAPSMPVTVKSGAKTLVSNTLEAAAPAARAVVGRPDAYAASSAGQIASALTVQQALTVEDSQGTRVDAKAYLNSAELRLLGQLPESARRKLLSVNRSQPVDQVRSEMQRQLKQIIGQMAQSSHVSFSQKSGSSWELESLLGLANAVNRLPLAQRKQLDGVTFMRAPRPDAPAGFKPALLDQVAMDTIAGRYDLSSKTVSLYDRGVSDSLPNIGAGLQQSLRNVQQRGNSEDVRQFQKMLNPYLALLNQPPIAADGSWGAGTAKAMRMVQIELLTRQAQSTHRLSSAQLKELRDLSVLAASPQFDMIKNMTNIQTKMENLNLLPDPHIKQLLQDFSKGDFGEASLKFLMQDISNDFRSTPSVSRVEEIMVHELGHHFQLGQSNESHYISEFGKLSHWKETGTGEAADGYIGGQYMNEDIKDVYHVLACDCKQDKGFYQPALSAEERSQKFVSDYAATDPMEDFAESYKDFVIDPARLLKTAPEKFFFINALPTIQARKTGVGAKEVSHYQPQQVEALARQVLAERYSQSPSDETVKSFIRQQFDTLMDTNVSTRRLGLNHDVMLAIVETHRPLLERAGMSYVETNKFKPERGADEAVFRKIHEQTQRLLTSNGNDQEASAFFNRFTQPNEIDKLFPRATPELRQKLKDPAFSSMMLAMGKIGGYATYINQLQNKDLKEHQTYQQAQNYFGGVIEKPSTLLSNKTFSYSWNYLRGLGSEVFNPEERKVSQALQFFKQLESNPEQAFPELWDRFPSDFRELLNNRRFVQAVSGDHGRYLPSSSNTRKVIEEVMEMVEFQRSLPALMGEN